jgi:hypothetical protein
MERRQCLGFDRIGEDVRLNPVSRANTDPTPASATVQCDRWPVRRHPMSHTVHLKVSGNTFCKLEFGTWVDNNSLLVQVKNLDFVNNTCLNMQDVTADPAVPEATGLWDGSPSVPLENLVVTGNRFVNDTVTAETTGLPGRAGNRSPLLKGIFPGHVYHPSTLRSQTPCGQSAVVQ